VPESSATTAADRNEQDRRFCEQLLTGLQVGIAVEDLRKVHPLGKRGNDASPRPVHLVHLESHITKKTF